MNGIYDEQKKSPLWKVIRKALKDLKNNKDLELTTHEDIVTGYIVKQLEE